jgi:protein tyrosine phosphatase (PTP) superfamily phosphohydrolase (DUF442 family)
VTIHGAAISTSPLRSGVRLLLALAAALHGCAAVAPPTSAWQLPNQVVIDARLVTAGQPERPQLLALRQQGFDAVVHIDAGRASKAVTDEAALVERQALQYVHIVVDAQALTADDARTVARALDQLSDRRVLVHCEQNMLSSTLVFLFRVLDRREDPRHALDDVERLWVPHGKIREFLQIRLRERGIELDAI